MELVIANTGIRQDSEGRFCLNDLHRASGGEAKHKPSEWLRNKQADELVRELEKAGIPAIESKQQLGTFVSRELVYAYAMWISPSFHLKVIRTFDQLASGRNPNLPAVPGTFAEALQLAADQAKQIEEQGRALIEMKPKAAFFDTVTGSKDAVDIGTVAKVLNMGIGRTKLFDFLRSEGVLMPNNQPYQQHIDAGYFRVIESTFNKPDGSSHVSFKTVVYQRGIEFIRRKLLKTREF